MDFLFSLSRFGLGWHLALWLWGGPWPKPAFSTIICMTPFKRPNLRSISSRYLLPSAGNCRKKTLRKSRLESTSTSSSVMATHEKRRAQFLKVSMSPKMRPGWKMRTGTPSNSSQVIMALPDFTK